MLKDKIVNIIRNHKLFEIVLTYSEETDDHNFLTTDNKVMVTEDNLIFEAKK